METSSTEHSEAAAILMDVSQQQIGDDVITNQSQAASILMNVGQTKTISYTETKPEISQIVLDQKSSQVAVQEDSSMVAMEGQETYSVPCNTIQNIVDVGNTDAMQETYMLSDGNETSETREVQQIKVMSSDGRYHTITMAGLEEKISESGEVQRSSIIQVDTPGRETEYITVSGLADNCSLESLAQIAEIVVNSTDKGNGMSLMEDMAVQESEATPAVETGQESEYIVMKESEVDVTVGAGEDINKSVLQTISFDGNQGSQNLVSLAQIAELVINQGGLEGQGSSMQELQIGSDANNQPMIISGLDTNIGDIQTVSSTSKKPSQPRTGKTEYIRVPLRPSQSDYINVPVRSTKQADTQSNYVTTILPDSRRNPPQKSSATKNIYSKIKAENGECYMVVLPESDPLNPAQLHNLLKSYSSEGKSVKFSKEEPLQTQNKPQMYSAGSQTNRKRQSLLRNPFQGVRQTQATEIVLCHPVPNKSSAPAKQVDGSCQVDPESLSAPEALLAQESRKDESIQVKVEVMDEGYGGPSTPSKVKRDNAQSENLDNCGHEVAVKKTPRDGPMPEMTTSMVQTDITASCYLNVTAEEMSIHKKREPRTHYNRVYLDDPKHGETAASSEQVEVSPFLERKNLIDPENAFYICGMCGVKYKTADELKIHCKSHRPKKASCPTCKKKCGNLKILADHVISHTRCKSFKCCVCTTDTVFKSAESFKAHVKEHLDDRHFICGSCNQKFVHVANLRVHMRVHTGEKPFECAKCSACFSQKASLEAHVSSFHNNEKPFKCEECGVNFARKTDLRIHLRKHTGERPYSCNICAKTFTSNSGLTSHKKTHYRKRYHQCQDCDKSFDTPARLKKHVQNWHEGEKALQCRVCTKEFNSRIELREHQNSHSDALFPCVSCSYGTTNKIALTNHIKENHPELIFKMPELFDLQELLTPDVDKAEDTVAVGNIQFNRTPDSKQDVPKTIEIKW